MLRVLAVDLGASAARVAAVDLDAVPPRVEVVHRVAHRPVRDAGGVLRWDWAALLEAVRTGLTRGMASGPVASIGVDTWGVDYGLLDASGALLAWPVSYRDNRTTGWTTVAASLDPARLYRTTGIQLMAINTVFQLAAHDRGELAAASRLLMLPELVIHSLGGAATGERTSAGTTGMVDLATGSWSAEIVAGIGVDPGLLPAIAEPLGVAGAFGGVPIHLVGGHDTASAVVAMCGVPDARAAFVSSGSWMLVGAERDGPDISDAAMRANFSNEPGVIGGVRFLRNVVGLWLLDQVLAGRPLADALAAADLLPDGGPVVDVATVESEAEVRAAAGLTNAGLDRVVRCVIDSIAAAVAATVTDLAAFLGGPVTELHLLGGGTANPLLVRGLSSACGIPVRLGPREATALGNALAQGIAIGRFDGLAPARAAVGIGVAQPLTP